MKAIFLALIAVSAADARAATPFKCTNGTYGFEGTFNHDGSIDLPSNSLVAPPGRATRQDIITLNLDENFADPFFDDNYEHYVLRERTTRGDRTVVLTLQKGVFDEARVGKRFSAQLSNDHVLSFPCRVVR